MSGDFDFEPVPGLPELLPKGERLLWQGAPDWQALAIRAFHIRKLAAYFGVLVLWRAVVAAHDGLPAMTALTSCLWLVGLAVVAIGLLVLFAWLIGRTTVYSITSKRLVMRIGVALPVTFNLPFQVISSAAVKLHAGGTGDLPIELKPSQRVSYLIFWPHARPWKIGRPQPMLRAIPEAEKVSETLAHALAEAAGQPAQTVTAQTRDPDAQWSGTRRPAAAA